MIEHVRTLQEQLKDFNGKLLKIKSKQIYHATVKNVAKNIVDTYFRNTKSFLTNAEIDKAVISDLDSNMQSLLEATHKSTTLAIYKKVISKIRKLTLEIEKLCLLAESDSNREFQLESVDKKIIDTLKGFIPSAALSYEQALMDLQVPERLSWRGPATDFRETLRECLDHLAPDKEIESSQGFKLEQNTNGPTMKQKTQYILQKRKLSKTAVKTTNKSVELIDEMWGSFVRTVYSRASVSTHTTTEKEEVKGIRNLLRIILCELLSIS